MHRSVSSPMLSMQFINSRIKFLAKWRTSVIELHVLLLVRVRDPLLNWSDKIRIAQLFRWNCSQLRLCLMFTNIDVGREMRSSVDYGTAHVTSRTMLILSSCLTSCTVDDSKNTLRVDSFFIIIPNYFSCKSTLRKVIITNIIIN